jgi:hypothetical protein
LLFIKANPDMVERVKWALKVFEGISGLTINLSKSELIPLNLDEFMGTFYAQMFNYFLGCLPIKYLGLRLH